MTKNSAAIRWKWYVNEYRIYQKTRLRALMKDEWHRGQSRISTHHVDSIVVLMRTLCTVRMHSAACNQQATNICREKLKGKTISSIIIQFLQLRSSRIEDKWNEMSEYISQVLCERPVLTRMIQKWDVPRKRRRSIRAPNIWDIQRMRGSNRQSRRCNENPRKFSNGTKGRTEVVKINITFRKSLTKIARQTIAKKKQMTARVIRKDRNLSGEDISGFLQSYKYFLSNWPEIYRLISRCKIRHLSPKLSKIK